MRPVMSVLARRSAVPALCDPCAAGGVRQRAHARAVVDARGSADCVEDDGGQLLGPVLGLDQVMSAGVGDGGQHRARYLLLDRRAPATAASGPSGRGGEAAKARSWSCGASGARPY